MALLQFQVDAFSNTAFGGNPAAVIVTEQPLAESLMLQIAAENNLSETAYVMADGDGWRIRWFTPTVEVDLCGHATLAAAWVLATEYGLLDKKPTGVDLAFSSRSGVLKVRVEPDSVTLDFAAQAVQPITLPELLQTGLAVAANTPCFKAQITNGNYLLVLPNEAAVQALSPNMACLEQVSDGGIIATAKGDKVDFVSRFFAPYYGIPEDPVTGSAHCSLVPYWAAVLAKQHLQARQISERGGELQCQLNGMRVLMSGQAVTVKQTEWRLSDVTLSTD